MAMWLVVAVVSALVFIGDLSEADNNITTVHINDKTVYINQTLDNLDWWQTAVIYQIYPRSFKDSDGDGIGDIKGMKLLLDFVPNHSSDRHEWFEKSSVKDDTYKDYYIWADGRINETTYERLPPNNWLSAFGGPAWTWSEDRGQYYFHSYSSRQPDLNYRNLDVDKEMMDVLKFWLDRGIDGFRVDAVHHLYEDKELRYEMRSNDPNARPGDYDSLVHNLTVDRPENYDLVARWRQYLDEYSKKDGKTRLLFVEDGRGNTNETMRYYGTMDKPAAHFPFNFDLIKKIEPGSNAEIVSSTILDWMSHVPRGNWYNWAASTHDTSRVASRLGSHMVDAINMLIMLLPGTAFTYNGEEIGMQDTAIGWNQTVDPLVLTAGRRRSRDPERTPFQWDDTQYAGFSTNKTWLPVNSNYKFLNLKTQMKASKSHYLIYKRLVAARKHPTIQIGSLTIHIPHADIFFFARELHGSDVFIVIMNLGNVTKIVDLGQYYSAKRDLSVYVSSVYSSSELNKVIGQKILLFSKEAIVLSSNEFKQQNAATFNIVSPALLLLAFVLSALINSTFR
ncbi:maltase 2-like isoform X2 [Periplaneta americana]|uniref:maltase 2-like isoform X2 n=1 Tax=Periplaneta americana TaxID=6978 RepID=UPI0037E8853A